MTRRYAYDHMNAQQFSQALDHLDLTTRQFARLSGAKEDNVLKWLDGTLDIPHWARVLCAVLELPGAVECAKSVTDMVVGRFEEKKGPAAD
jgi:hypothetical protein